MRPGKLSEHLKGVTERELGKGINLHLYRKIISTELAIHDPAHTGIAQPLLGHATYRMTEQAYNLGRAIDAARKVGAVIGTLRKKDEE
jgi:integrase